MPLVEIKKCNEFIDNKSFCDQLVKNKQKVYEKLVEMSRSNDYTIGNLLDYFYHRKYYKIHWYRFIKANKYEYSSTN